MSVPEDVIDAAMSAVLDPGAHTPRGADAEGNDYGEPLDAWQRRALAIALDGKVNPPFTVPDFRQKRVAIDHSEHCRRRMAASPHPEGWCAGIGCTVRIVDA